MGAFEQSNEQFENALMPPIFRFQLVRENHSERMTLHGPVDAARILCSYLESEDREHFVSMMLDVKNRVIGIHTVSIGNLNSAIVSPREVFKAAILANAASIIVGHNHPSGDVTPSPEDVQVTSVLKKAGELLGIEVLDHIIVGEEGAHASLKQLRML
jgi:DNA repair protein RadC